jgi:hypothetical protein
MSKKMTGGEVVIDVNYSLGTLHSFKQDCFKLKVGK